MNTITVHGKLANSQILIGESINNLDSYIFGRNCFIVTDKNVERFYKKRFPKSPVFSIDPGENSKRLKIVEDIYRWLLDNEADRNSIIVGIGGGVVCDIAGFVASTFMRGVDFGFVATTLLAQVDASVGGKNGVDLDGYKNIIGTFNQPKFVVCDIAMLNTLPDGEFKNGMAEVVKHALIADASMFEFIEKNVSNILNIDHEKVEYLVTRSIEIKSKIVENDEREAGLRRVLNLGHTWGHAVETLTRIPHGQAVSIGLVYAANLSVEKNLMAINERDRLITLLSNLGLPTSTKADSTEIFKTLQKDKKREKDYIHYVLMKGIGNVVVEKVKFSNLV